MVFGTHPATASDMVMTLVLHIVTSTEMVLLSQNHGKFQNCESDLQTASPLTLPFPTIRRWSFPYVLRVARRTAAFMTEGLLQRNLSCCIFGSAGYKLLCILLRRLVFLSSFVPSSPSCSKLHTGLPAWPRSVLYLSHRLRGKVCTSPPPSRQQGAAAYVPAHSQSEGYS